MGLSVALIQSPVRTCRSNKGDPLNNNIVRKLRNHARRTDRPATNTGDSNLTLLSKTCVSVDSLLLSQWGAQNLCIAVPLRYSVSSVVRLLSLYTEDTVNVATS
jgi:hypothetical protein